MKGIVSFSSYRSIRGREKKIIYYKNYAELELNNGEFTKIDIEDVDKCIKHSWTKTSHKSILRGGYIHSNIGGKYTKLHHFVSGYKYVDHINRDSLDNRKSNLRLSSPYENNRNTSRNIFIEFNGIKKCIKDWSNELGINRETLRYNFHRGRHIILMKKHFQKDKLISL